LKEQVEKECYAAVLEYFGGKGNGPEAKLSAVMLGNIYKKDQAINNARSLDLLTKRLAATENSLLLNK